MRSSSLLLAVALAAPAAAEPDWTTPAPVPPLSIPALPPTSRSLLSNGIRTSYTALAGAPVLSAVLVLPRAGSSGDPKGMEGLAALVGALTTQGIPGLDAGAFKSALDALGASFSIDVGPDAATVSVSALKETFGDALALARQVLERAELRPERLEQLRARSLAGLEMGKGDPSRSVQAALQRRLNGPEHPRGRAITAESLGALGPEQARAFYARGFAPEGASLHMAGDLSPEEARLAAERFVGDWKAASELIARASTLPPAPVPAAPEAQSPGTIELMDFPGAKQSVMRLGMPAIPRSHPDNAAFGVMNGILGGGWARLSDNLRKGLNRDGLAPGERGEAYTYSAGSGYSAHKDAGALVVGTSVDAKHTGAALWEIVRELRRIQDEPVTDDELSRGVNARLLGILEAVSQTGSAAGVSASGELLGLPDGYLAEAADAVRRVSKEDVQRVARAYIKPESAVIVIAGDERSIRAQVEAAARRVGWKVRLVDADGKPRGQG